MSERIAAEQNSVLDTEHQLLALILFKGTLAYDILRSFEVSMDRAQLVAGLVSKRRAGTKGLGLSADAKESIRIAVQSASKFKHAQVDCEHLLLALVSKKTFNSFSVVERIGINPKSIADQVESIFGEVKKSQLPKADENVTFETGDEAQIFPDDQAISPFGPIPGIPLAKTKQKSSNILKQFTFNISDAARTGKLDPVIGRTQEIERIMQILSRRKKNNPVLIGEPGVGKTAIIEGLAQKIADGHTPASISEKEIYSLDLAALVAGTMYRGQFEQRLKNLLDEIQKNRNIILFIDEIHSVIGAGSAEGSMDLANILKPKLAKGDISVIGATTLDEYKKHIERDAAFERRFQPVVVPETSDLESVEILKGIKKNYESHHGITYSDNALMAAVKLSKRYISDRFLPDKAIDLIDEAAAYAKLKVNPPKKLIKLKGDLTKILRKKDDAVASEQYELATLLRGQEKKIVDEINKIERLNKNARVSIISENDIANVVSRWSGVPVANLTLSDKKNYLDLDKKIKKYIVGQDKAVDEIVKSIKRSRVGVSDPVRPIGSFMFLGPTGVGKTALVKVLAREFYGRENALVKIDMSEFMERHNLSRLVGAPAGYVGFEEGGRLTEQIRRNPYSLVLFDEIEKAHPEIFNILLQILEDGELTDAKGRRIDFKNTLVIMTSNIGTDFASKQFGIGFGKPTQSDADHQKLKEKVLESLEKKFRPEFVNRLDNIIVFSPLSERDIKKIVEIEIKKLSNRIANSGISVTIKNNAKKLIAKRGYKPEFGARPMRKVISEQIEAPLSEAILTDKLTFGDKVTIDYNYNDESLIITKNGTRII
jgi:ATP-dependent Clp protease ATP-binding subunit ClpC